MKASSHSAAEGPLVDVARTIGSTLGTVAATVKKARRLATGAGPRRIRRKAATARTKVRRAVKRNVASARRSASSTAKRASATARLAAGRARSSAKRSFKAARRRSK
jgi:hypothetical protein